jgi:hypothetical protein
VRQGKKEAAGSQTPTKSAHSVVGEIVLASAPKQARPHEVMVAPGSHPHVDVGKKPTKAREPAPTLRDPAQWHRLLTYYRSCVVEEAASEGIDVRGNGFACWSGQESILSGAREVPVPTEAVDFVRRLSAMDKELFYGYPAIVLFQKGEGRNHRAQPSIAPLFMQQLEVRDDGKACQVAPVGPITPHPWLVRKILGLRDEEATALIDSFEAGWRSGDSGQLEREARKWLDEWGVKEVQRLDPLQLSNDLALQPPTPGARNVAVVFETPEGSVFTKQLLKDLEELSAKAGRIPDTALGAIDGDEDPGRTGELSTIACPLAINEAQEAAIRSAMTRRLTVATGPPGTGKSQLIVNLVATAIAAGQTVLVASTNNRAVDEVFKRCRSIHPGLLVRTGGPRPQPDLQDRFGASSYRDLEIETLRRLLEQRPEPADTSTARHTLRLREQDLDKVRRELATQADLERELALLGKARKELADSLWRDGTTSPVGIASEAGLRTWLARTRRAKRLGWFGLLARRSLGSTLSLPDATRNTLQSLDKLLEAERGWRSGKSRLAELRPDAERLNELRWAEERLQKASLEAVVATLTERVEGGRTLLRQRLEALQEAATRPSGSGAPKGGWAEFLRLKQGCLGGWAVTTRSIRAFPPNPGLFDLAIVDEASQCSIPDVVPVLFRAKRALIIGDPMQLTQVVTLTPSAEASCRMRASIPADWLEEKKLAYRRHSAFHALKAAAGGASLLDEHYRCHPAIADVSNRLFYAGRLTVLTDSRNLLRMSGAPVLQWRNVRGTTERSRDSWLNRSEAEHAAAVVGELLEGMPSGADIGVVTPFHAQAELIKSLCRDERVRVGTVHTFQGGERDAMVLSLVGGASMPDGTRWWMQRQASLWNVAITRAKAHLIVVGDREYWAKHGGAAGELTEAADGASGLADHPSRDSASDPTADALHRFLETRTDLQFVRDTTKDGCPCDFLLEVNGKTVAVLLDRGSTGSDPARHLRVQLQRRECLEGTGDLRVVRIPSWCVLDTEDELLRRLNATS